MISLIPSLDNFIQGTNLYAPCTCTPYPIRAEEIIVTPVGRTFEGFRPALFVNSQRVKPLKGINGLVEATFVGLDREHICVRIQDVDKNWECFFINLQDWFNGKDSGNK